MKTLKVKVTLKGKYGFDDIPKEFANVPFYTKEVQEWHDSFNLSIEGPVVDMVVDWYKKQIEDFDVVDVSYNTKTKLLTIKYKGEVEYPKFLADPDDDGNYPLQYNGKTYLVIGEIF
jgi:hypothetical protein